MGQCNESLQCVWKLLPWKPPPCVVNRWSSGRLTKYNFMLFRPTLGNESITSQDSALYLFNQLRSSRNKSTIEHYGAGSQELSGDGSGSGSDSSAVVEDVDIPILKASCHYKDQPSGFILLLQLNFWLMFILPLGVGICKIYERDIQSMLTGKHFFYMDMQSHA